MSFTRINPTGYGVGAKVTSAQFNQLDEDHSRSAADWQAFVGSWQPGFAFAPTGSGGAGGAHAATWNDQAQGVGGFWGQSWLLAGLAAGSPARIRVYANSGADQQFTQVGADVNSVLGVTSMCVDGEGDIWFAVAGASNFLASLTPSGSTFNVYGTLGLTLTDAKIVPSPANANVVICAFGSGTAGQAALGILALTGGDPVYEVSPLTAASWILRSNGATVIAIPMVTGASVYSTTDGFSWSTTPLSGTLGASDVPIDAAWNPTLQQWLMAVNSAGTGHTSFWTSQNGTAWAATGTTLSSVPTVTSVSALGSFWMAAVYNTATFSSQMITSTDGVTWKPSPIWLYSGGANAPAIVSSPRQSLFLAGASTSGTPFNEVRWSGATLDGDSPLS